MEFHAAPVFFENGIFPYFLAPSSTFSIFQPKYTACFCGLIKECVYIMIVIEKLTLLVRSLSCFDVDELF